MRRRPTVKRDANHAEIVHVLEAVHAQVVDLAVVGEGCPDILVGFLGTWVLMEIKDGSKPPSERELTKPQEDFFKTARARHLPCYVVFNQVDAMAVLATLRPPARTV